MIKLLVASLAVLSLSARAESNVSAQVNAWVASRAKQLADSRLGLEGDFSWKLNSEGMIYSGFFATAKKDLCTVSAYRSLETAERLDYTVLLSCRNSDVPAESGFTKIVGTFRL